MDHDPQADAGFKLQAYGCKTMTTSLGLNPDRRNIYLSYLVQLQSLYLDKIDRDCQIDDYESDRRRVRLRVSSVGCEPKSNAAETRRRRGGGE